MDTLTHTQLVERIRASKGVLIIGLLSLLDCRARKTNNPFGMIVKQVRAVGFVGADYEQAVNREAIRQGETPEFEAESLPWGEWLIPNKVIAHKGKYYLRTQTTPGNRRKQPAKVICYRDALGKFLSHDDVKPFLPVARESNKQQEETGINKTVWVRTYCFDSIQVIRIAGKSYKLVADDAKPKLGETYKAIETKAKEIRPNDSGSENTVEMNLARVSIIETNPE